MRVAPEINRLNTLNETDKTFVRSAKHRQRSLRHHEQLEFTFLENRKPLSCNLDVKFALA